MFWQRAWYRSGLHPLLLLLFPLHALFVTLSTVRRWLYQVGFLAIYRAPVPVIVVGNISVGGTGKTPVTEALVQWLKQQGYSPAIVSRGYGAKGPFPQLVTATSLAQRVGDEPKLLAVRTGVPLAVSPNRQQAIELILQMFPDTDIILSDDGLQHYRLARDIEIAVVDGNRGLGNGWRLPLGPLREPAKRLAEVDFVVQNGLTQHNYGWPFTLQPQNWKRVKDSIEVTPPQGECIAIAGIGHPQRFFDTLKQQSIVLKECIEFADHHPFSASDFAQIDDSLNVLMTEKDAAKCQLFAKDSWFYLPVSAEFDEGFWQQLRKRLQDIASKE
ncbi:tetraacyldisaccharide 4'-kinase [Pseudidiomarina marina]|uniref:Tetraacyldisaccharide 4'-kinase n=1 Tax=Pseudidiomarina marina TaxID=502366 RepID=A0A432YJ11_9GAMM|nr:tetraacyldisaccharide 4'-kinase [Pseudidiomarina marina]RUO60930.1 tetraacyldisaccharide 4'-kinase [Pseudidiomarina marina]